MTEFTKTKIAFALALLAALFTISPILKDIGTTGYLFLGIIIQVRYAYYVLLALLAIAVYCYGLELISERSSFDAERAGNTAYALALLVPPVYVALFVIAQLGKVAVWISKSPTSIALFALYALEFILGAATMIFMRAITSGFAKTLAERDRSSAIEELSNREVSLISRASEMSALGHYDLAVLESFRAIEASIRKALRSKDISFRGRTTIEMLKVAEKAGIIDPELLGYIHKIRRMRHRAAHEGEPISQEAAEDALALARKVVASLESDSESDDN
jgi:HEPN domain-containing protein